MRDYLPQLNNWTAISMAVQEAIRKGEAMTVERLVSRAASLGQGTTGLNRRTLKKMAGMTSVEVTKGVSA